MRPCVSPESVADHRPTVTAIARRIEIETSLVAKPRAGHGRPRLRQGAETEAHAWRERAAAFGVGPAEPFRPRRPRIHRDSDRQPRKVVAGDQFTSAPPHVLHKLGTAVGEQRVCDGRHQRGIAGHGHRGTVSASVVAASIERTACHPTAWCDDADATRAVRSSDRSPPPVARASTAALAVHCTLSGSSGANVAMMARPPGFSVSNRCRLERARSSGAVRK